jgi:hypothetical protein
LKSGRSNEPMIRVQRTIPLLAWDDGVRERIMSYWRGRGFVFNQTDGDFLAARRGSLRGNVTSFDPAKLRATLSVARTNLTEVLFLMEVNTHFQVIVEWDRRYWELEMETLESFLRRDDLQEQRWKEFRRDSTRSFLLWGATGGLMGKRLSSRWKDR